MKATRELFDALRGWQWWPLIASLVLILAFLAGFYWRTDVRAALCTAAKDEHCGREWASALSGWAAFLAAIVTMRFLRRQIEEANRHQRENVELTIMGKMRLANNCHSCCSQLRHRCGMAAAILSINFLDPVDLRWSESMSFNMAIEKLQQIKDGLEDEVITTYQRDVGWVGIDVSSAVTRVKDGLAILQAIQDGRILAENLAEHERERIRRDLKLAVEWAADAAHGGQAHSLAFIQKWGIRMDSGF